MENQHETEGAKSCWNTLENDIVAAEEIAAAGGFSASRCIADGTVKVDTMSLVDYGTNTTPGYTGSNSSMTPGASVTWADKQNNGATSSCGAAQDGAGNSELNNWSNLKTDGGSYETYSGAGSTTKDGVGNNKHASSAWQTQQKGSPRTNNSHSGGAGANHNWTSVNHESTLGNMCNPDNSGFANGGPGWSGAPPNRTDTSCASSNPWNNAGMTAGGGAGPTGSSVNSNNHNNTSATKTRSKELSWNSATEGNGATQQGSLNSWNNPQLHAGSANKSKESTLGGWDNLASTTHQATSSSWSTSVPDMKSRANSFASNRSEQNVKGHANNSMLHSSGSPGQHHRAQHNTVSTNNAQSPHITSNNAMVTTSMMSGSTNTLPPQQSGAGKQQFAAGASLTSPVGSSSTFTSSGGHGSVEPGQYNMQKYGPKDDQWAQSNTNFYSNKNSALGAPSSSAGAPFSQQVMGQGSTQGKVTAGMGATLGCNNVNSVIQPPNTGLVQQQPQYLQQTGTL